jgi:hypothetical protein
MTPIYKNHSSVLQVPSSPIGPCLPIVYAQSASSLETVAADSSCLSKIWNQIRAFFSSLLEQLMRCFGLEKPAPTNTNSSSLPPESSTPSTPLPSAPVTLPAPPSLESDPPQSPELSTLPPPPMATPASTPAPIAQEEEPLLEENLFISMFAEAIARCFGEDSLLDPKENYKCLIGLVPIDQMKSVPKSHALFSIQQGSVVGRDNAIDELTAKALGSNFDFSHFSAEIAFYFIKRERDKRDTWELNFLLCKKEPDRPIEWNWTQSRIPGHGRHLLCRRNFLEHFFQVRLGFSKENVRDLLFNQT